jgi:hypothetical protein
MFEIGLRNKAFKAKKNFFKKNIIFKLSFEVRFGPLYI